MHRLAKSIPKFSKGRIIVPKTKSSTSINLRAPFLPHSSDALGALKQFQAAIVVPKSDLGVELNKTIVFSSHTNSQDGNLNISISKSFSEIPPKDCRLEFKKKCMECSKLCDFTVESKDIQAKVNKGLLLQQIIQGTNIPHLVKSVSADMVQCFFQMVSVNIFRSFPPISLTGPEDSKDFVNDAAWQHISLVYDAMSMWMNVPQFFEIPTRFLTRFSQNLLSPDERERQTVGIILSNITARLPNYRLCVRKGIFHMIADNNVSAELLDCSSNIISSFPIPLKQDAIELFRYGFLPLHRLDNYPFFYKSLLLCILKFISKDLLLVDEYVLYMIHHFPIASKRKQNLFIKEIEEILLNFGSNISDKLIGTLFRLISSYIPSPCTQLSESALCVVTNSRLQCLLHNHSQRIMMNIVLSFLDAKSSHWDERIREKMNSNEKFVQYISPDDYNRIVDNQKMLVSRLRKQQDDAVKNWEIIYYTAVSNYSSDSFPFFLEQMINSRTV